MRSRSRAVTSGSTVASDAHVGLGGYPRGRSSPVLDAKDGARQPRRTALTVRAWRPVAYQQTAFMTDSQTARDLMISVTSSLQAGRETLRCGGHIAGVRAPSAGSRGRVRGQVHLQQAVQLELQVQEMGGATGAASRAPGRAGPRTASPAISDVPLAPQAGVGVPRPGQVILGERGAQQRLEVADPA